MTRDAGVAQSSSPPRVTIELLGPVRVAIRGRPVSPAAWDRKKTRSLLTLLLTAPGRVFSLDDIGAALWPNLDARAVAASVQAVVSKLRRVLDPGRGRGSRSLLTEGGGYRFAPGDDCLIDTIQVDAWWRGGREAQECERWNEALSCYDSALACYRGEYAAEESGAWIVAHREHWRRLRRALRAARGECLSALGRYSDAVEAWGSLLDDEPCDEETTRRLMLAHYAVGHLNDATLAFRRCADALARELGADPSEELLALSRQILKRRVPGIDAAPRVPVTVKRASKAPYSLGRLHFAGREREIGLLASMLDSAASGRGRIVTIGGEPGIGKSRLADELALYARSRSSLTASGRCYPPPLRRAYEPLTEMLRQILNTPMRDVLRSLASRWSAALRDVVPELTERTSATSPAASHRLRDALPDMLVGVSERRPLVLVVEDLQWADDDTLDVLHALAARVPEAPILLLATYRPDEAAARPAVSAWLEAVHRLPSRDMALAPLLREAVTDLLRAMSSSRQSPDEISRLADRLHGETQGHPLALVETLQSLLEHGGLTVNGRGKWLVSDAGRAALDMPAWPVPAGVRQLVLERVGDLDPTHRTAVELLSTLDRGIRSELIRCLEASDAVDELVRRRFIQDDRQFPGVYRFVHDHIRRVIYDALPIGSRREHHLRVAEALAALGGSGHVELAHHFLQAERWEPAAHHALAAAAEARNTFAFGAAREWLDRAASVLAEKGLMFLSPPDLARRRFAVLKEQAEVLGEQGHAAARRAAVADMMRLARRFTEPAELAAAWLALAGLHAVDRDWKSGVDAAQRAIACYETLGDRAALAAAYRDLGYIYWRADRLADAVEANQRALALHEELGQAKGAAGDRHNLAQIYTSMGRSDLALESFRRARRAYRELGERQGEACALNILPHVSRLGGHPSEALAAALDALALAEETGNTHGALHYHLDIASLHHTLGRRDLALEAYEAALAAAQSMGGKQSEEGYALRGAGIIHVEEGRRDRAETSWTLAVARFGECGDLASRTEICRRLGDLGMEGGHPDQAYAWYRSALAGVDSAQAPGSTRMLAMRMGHACWALGRAAEAIPYYRDALRLADAQQDRAAQGAACAALGVVYRETGALTEARAAGIRAWVLARGLRDTVGEDYVLSGLAESYLALGWVRKAECAARLALTRRRSAVPPDRGREGWAQYRLGTILGAGGTSAAARDALAQARTLAVEADDRALLDRLVNHKNEEVRHAKIHDRPKRRPAHPGSNRRGRPASA